MMIKVTLLCDTLACLTYSTWTVPTRIKHVDPVPGFVLQEYTSALLNLGFPIEVGHVEPSWKSCWKGSTLKLVSCQKPGGSHVAELWLDVATVDLNSRLHIQGLHCEIWRKYNQFTHEQAPVSDMQHIIAKHTNRQRMPWLIEAFGSYKL